jgi:DNA polymerase III delta' subunit
MDGVRTRGHVPALAAIRSMIRGRAPHAVLLVGPAGVGKTTLALDLAAGLLCTAAVADRPCGTCRACRLVASGGHPDVHLLGPEGAGRQIVIGGPTSKARGIRDLVTDLALMPVEGGARVAIVTSAQRMNEDAQAALLKTLEEPPSGVTVVLCADAEEPLLPTIRSRCARLRLGPVGPRAIEAILADHGAADAAIAARLARLAAGRPGVALAWAGDPDAIRARDELARVLLDLIAARPAERLASIRAALGTATTVARLTDRAARQDGAPDVGPETSSPDEADGAAPTRVPAADRRRAAESVVAVWTDVARDLTLVARGMDGSVRDPRILDEARAAAPFLDRSSLLRFLDRLGRASVLLAGNVAPQLVLDDLAIAWPREHRPAT